MRTVYVDADGCIKDVDNTGRTDLTAINLDDTLKNYPFNGWSDTKICCYKIKASNGVVAMMAPYVDTRVIEQLDKLGTENQLLKEQTESMQEAIDFMLME